METPTEEPLTRLQIIEQQKAKFERVLTHVEPGFAIEIIRYGAKSVRSLSAATYTGGNRDFYNKLITSYFNHACTHLKEGQRLRIQVVKG